MVYTEDKGKFATTCVLAISHLIATCTKVYKFTVQLKLYITNNMLYFNTDYIGLLAMKITIPIMSVVLYQSTWVYIYITYIPQLHGL